MSEILIGIDDTDMPGTRGTGWRARRLAQLLRDAGHATRGVTRHQLLVDDRVPYTSHNSAACIAAAGDAGLICLWDLAREFLLAHSDAGSDPGLCVAPLAGVHGFIAAFGRRAQCEVVTRATAESLAQEAGIRLTGLGGTCDDVIGALAAVGLRSTGDDGRFIELGAVRDIEGLASVRQIRNAGVARVVDVAGNELDSREKVETMNWVRPDLRGGEPVMTVERSNSCEGHWKPVGKDKPKERRRD